MAATATLSSASSASGMRASWNVPAMPARQTASGVCAVMGLPSKRTSPPMGESRPETTLSSVVLPEPLGPTSPTTSPRSTANETPSTAARPPKCRSRPPTSSRAERLMARPFARSGRAQAAAVLRPSRWPRRLRARRRGWSWCRDAAAQPPRQGLEQVGQLLGPDCPLAGLQQADDAIRDEEDDAQKDQAQQDAEMVGKGDREIVFDQDQRHDAEHRTPD